MNMKPSEHFYSSLPIHLLPATPVAAGPKAEPQAEPKPPAYIWPEITAEDHKKTLNNYRSYIQAVNDSIPGTNREIVKYNKLVTAHIAKNPISPELGKKIGQFTGMFNALMDHEYNAAVESFNTTHGPSLKKRTYKTIKPVTLQIFEAVLHAYTVHLRKHVNIWKQSSKFHATPLPKCPVNPYEISRQERGEGVTNLDLSTRTIRRHRDRLAEIGVLQHKEFRGLQRAVNYFISPEILSVSEAYSSKMLNPQNQPFKGEQRTSCQQYKVSTRTNLNKKEIKGIVNNSEDRNAPLSLKFSFYKTTQPQVDAKNQTGPRKNVKVSPKNTKVDDSLWIRHVENLDSRYTLAGKLANGEFNFYIPLDMKFLNKLSTIPISDNDFRDLAVQDFARSAAAINRYNQASAGSWYNALGEIDKDFGCFNFTGNAQSKSAVLKRLVEFRYRLRWALNWFERREWTNRPYASRYFDPYRTLPTDISWQYTEKVWSKKMKKIADQAAKKKLAEYQAKKRKEALSTDRKANQRLDNAIYRYLRSELDLNQLTEFVFKLPKKQQERFPSRLDELNRRRLTKTA